MSSRKATCVLLASQAMDQIERRWHGDVTGAISSVYGLASPFSPHVFCFKSFPSQRADVQTSHDRLAAAAQESLPQPGG